MSGHKPLWAGFEFFFFWDRILLAKDYEVGNRNVDDGRYNLGRTTVCLINWMCFQFELAILSWESGQENWNSIIPR